MSMGRIRPFTTASVAGPRWAFSTRFSAKRGILPRHIGRIKGGLNTKLHAVCDGMGRPIALCLTAGQTSDHLGAKTLYSVLPDGPDITLIGDKGYDSDDYRAALRAKGITA